MNGKGDADSRVTKRQQYRDNYDEIDWHRGPKFRATFVRAPKKLKPTDLVAIRHEQIP